MESVINFLNISKYYGKQPGIAALNLEIYPGEVFGFLGPNGAGKTTTIRLMLHLLKPSSGRILVFGKNVSQYYRQIFKQIGNLPGELKLYEHLSGIHYLDFMSGFLRNEPRWRNDLLSAFKFSPADLGRKIKYYSHGMKQKLGIIQALQNDPDLIVMDEPTEGLDPLNKTVLYDFLMFLKSRGKTIFFSSHNLAEVEKICDRVGLVRAGQLIALEGIENLKKKMVRRMEITFDGDYKAEDFTMDNVAMVDRQPGRLILNISGDINPIIKKLSKYKLNNLVFPEPSLEETFMKFYRN
ncbi:MAG: ABC transporter ATP-binding protein [Calditrichaceae bacterium]|nr:ABC transporter ATP-binding protein [Calditrichaceae bacterium]MBN2708542.1 ABC transporter ATP-binding protein [Calditrichaceae bacterium]RQV93497.1 MAG: ABC transporter ATP-binding protein [Calditrichota bacterium]